MNFYKELGGLILGSRLKRMSDRLLLGINKVYQEQGIAFDASWFPVFYLLDRHKKLSIMQMMEQLEVSHSAVSQLVSNLEKKGLVQTVKDPVDGRRRLVSFTTEGELLKETVEKTWQALSHAVEELLSEGEYSQYLFKAFNELEGHLEGKSLEERVLSRLEKDK